MANNSEYRNKWISEKLDRINLTVPKGKKEEIQDHAAMMGESVNAFINRSITMTMIEDECKEGWRSVVSSYYPTERDDRFAALDSAKQLHVTYDKLIQSEAFCEGLEAIKRQSEAARNIIFQRSPIPQYMVVYFPKLNPDKQKIFIEYVLEQDNEWI